MIVVKRKYLDSSGFATLEVLGALLVLLPFILAALALVEKSQTQRELEQIISGTVDQMKIKPFEVSTGDQGYFLYVRGETDNSNRGSSLENVCRDERLTKKDSIQSEICASYRYLLDRIKNSSLCAPHGCKDSKYYRIDLRFFMVRINRQTGRLDYIDKMKNYYKEIKYFRTGSAGNLPIVSNKAQIMGKSVKDFIMTNPGLPFIYAITSPLLGTQTKQFYGNWDSRDSDIPGGFIPEDPNKLRNYLRFSFLVALGVEVDITNTLAGRFETYMNYLKPGSAQESSKKTVYASRIVSPRNSL